MSTAKTSRDVVQPFGHLADRRIGLRAEIRHKSIAALNRMLAHTLALRDLYKKAHWQSYGATFYPFHLLFDKHANEQAGLADVVGGRLTAARQSADSVEPVTPPLGLSRIPVMGRRISVMDFGFSRQGFRNVSQS